MRLRLHNDKVMPAETDALCTGCDPLVAANDDNCIDHPHTEAPARRNDEVLLDQSSTHPLPIATCHRCLKLAHHGLRSERFGVSHGALMAMVAVRPDG